MVVFAGYFQIYIIITHFRHRSPLSLAIGQTLYRIDSFRKNILWWRHLSVLLQDLWMFCDNHSQSQENDTYCRLSNIAQQLPILWEYVYVLSAVHMHSTRSANSTLWLYAGMECEMTGGSGPGSSECWSGRLPGYLVRRSSADAITVQLRMRKLQNVCCGM
jgi:hypothetical protein